VLELKMKIFDVRGSEYIVEKQKLIYAGVILVDDHTISSYNVDEKKFIVVMLSRDTASSTCQSRIKEADKNQTCFPNTHTLPSECSESTDTFCGSTNPPFTTTSTNETIQSNDLVVELENASLQSRAESNLLMGDDYTQTVRSMIEMGYPREHVERAMSASFNNPERAVEYLVNGIPAEEENIFNVEEESTNPSSAQSGTQNVSETYIGQSAGFSLDPFEFMRSQPQFLQLRSLIFEHPQLLHDVLQQIGQTNPALLQLISENQDAFLNMLNQPIESESGTGDAVPRTSNRRRRVFSSELEGAVAAQRLGTNELRENQTGGNYDFEPPGVAAISLNSQDQEAIERLKALGFPEALVLQAYFACEKNEELAANFLLSSSFDD
ncbi:hypothetical protein KR074_008450, partial [Drosophila pseudoananassae]